ncbi:uncharacterized protein [Littorina saxatilis]|uniref:uncharacterized protein isoform X2 n=1 Tax=Littorina saxatilis TaxID=31220 RepID=UPI0038B4F4DD
MNTTVIFTVHNACNNEAEDIKSLKVFRGTKPKFEAASCHITFINETCSIQAGCSCDEQSREFSMVTAVDKVDDTSLFLFGELRNGVRFNKTITLNLNAGYQSTSLTTEIISWSEVSETTGISSSPPPTTAASQNGSGTQVGFFILGGVVGFVLLVVTILSICMGVLFWKRGRPRRLPPPPPAPHNARRAAGNAVMYPAAQGGSDCSVSVLGHEYAEIPDDTDTGKSNSTLTSVHSSPMSDMSDCLHHIACPSSDSSLPEDYLNPVASSWEAVAIATIKEERCISSSSSEAVMYAEERITFKKKTRKNVNTAIANLPNDNAGDMQL